ncbi:Vacuolar protease A [Mortierella claussenii]|nr:Vacuolar protease A [Mortierella claussenii]
MTSILASMGKTRNPTWAADRHTIMESVLTTLCNDDHGNITTSDCGNSSSSRLTTQSTGDLLGIVGSDRLALTEGVVVKNPPQAFGEIVDERHGGLRDALWEQKDRAITAGTTSHADGVLGLGYDPDAVTGRPLLLNLQDQHTLKENVFGVYLSRGDTDTGVDHVDHPHRPESELTLGGLDPNHRQAEIQWHEVTRVATGQWAIELTAFALKREAFEIDGNAVIDTGFPYIALTRYQAESINAQIGGVETEKGSGVYEVPCQNVPEFFEFILLFGQEEYQLKGNEYIVQKRTTRQEGGAKRGKASDHQDVCQSAIIGMDFSKESGVVAIFGEVFLKKYYSAYDLDHHRLGFALAT